MTLTEFLLERIAEDEATAQDACSGTDGYWKSVRSGIRLAGGSSFRPVQDEQIHLRYAVHIARWDPARVLAECATKRQLVELHREVTETRQEFYPRRTVSVTGCGTCRDYAQSEWFVVDGPCETLQLLAQSYAIGQEQA